MNTKKLNARRSSAGAIVALLISAIGFFPANVQAAPADEITRAVIAAGATSVADATAKTFIQGFSSVIVRPKCDDIAKYVTAALKLRPDLASAITVAAIRAHRRDVGDTSCDCVDAIIRAALLAAPDAKKALVRAVLDSEPWARECVIAASGLSPVGAGETETAFFRPPGIDAGNINSTAIGTINPANVGGSGGGNVNTPENDATTICHNGQTIVVSREGAEAHIRNHPTDHLGACGP